MSTLHLRFFGEFQLLGDVASHIRLNSPRTQALLAFLVLHRQAPQSRSHVAFQLWPDVDEPQARGNLRYQLHVLRRSLPNGKDLVYADEQVLQWQPGKEVTSDLEEFERALEKAKEPGDSSKERAAYVEAVTLYRGELLPSCYDDWIQPERERLREMHVGAMARLSRLLEQQGDYRTAIEYAQRLLRYDPLHEETYRRLMHMHMQNGDHVSALRAYHTCAAVLKRELAVEPSPATRAQYEELLRSTPARSEPGSRSTPLYAALTAPNAPPHNLRLALTSFIGRERELSTVKRMLGTTRLLTLTGIGGTGKTRLALEAATELLLESGPEAARLACPDGMWWIELAGLTEPELVAQTVAAVIGVREHSSQSSSETLVEYLRTKRVLIGLDNCEHLIGACADLAESILSQCPGVRILATSRERLKVSGETVRVVPPLSLPHEAVSNVDLFLMSTHAEAVRLFNERAASAFPAFELTRKNVSAVVEICRKVDGLPLALELAAARVKIMRVEQISERLHDRFSLLKAGHRRGDSRHQSLRAVMDWSYELLAPPERLLFQRLSVFVGGFSLEAVEAVCAGDGIETTQLLELLSLIVDKSLVTVDQGSGAASFSLLETLRQYANEKLRESEQADAVGNKHTNYYLALAERGNAELEGPREGQWLELLEREHDNLRAVLGRILDHDDSERGVRIAAALGPFWNNHGHQTEGRRWLEAMLARSGDSISLARGAALCRLGELLISQGDYPPARDRLEQSLEMSQALGNKHDEVYALVGLAITESHLRHSVRAHVLSKKGLELARELGDKRMIACAFLTIANIALNEADAAVAREAYEESLKLFRQVGWNSRVAFVLNNLGEVARTQGEYDRALALYEESLTFFRQLDDRMRTALALNNIGFVAQQSGEKAKAKAAFDECLRMWLAMGLGVARGAPESLVGVAGILGSAGAATEAVKLLAAAAGAREVNPLRWDAVDRADLDRTLDAVRAQLDPASFELAWAEGRFLTQEEAVTEALAHLQCLDRQESQ